MNNRAVVTIVTSQHSAGRVARTIDEYFTALGLDCVTHSDLSNVILGDLDARFNATIVNARDLSESEVSDLCEELSDAIERDDITVYGTSFVSWDADDFND